MRIQGLGTSCSSPREIDLKSHSNDSREDQSSAFMSQVVTSKSSSDVILTL